MTHLKQFLRRYVILIALVLAVGTSNGQSIDGLWNNLPEDSRPWNYWYWHYGAISKEGITADLEAMKANGIGGAFIFTIKGVPRKPFITPSYTQLTPEWWEMIKHAVSEADRLGVKIGYHVCDGWALAGGKWITPELSMQILTSSRTYIEGGKHISMKLPTPPNNMKYYEDIATYAFPTTDGNVQSTDTVKPEIRTSNNADAAFLTENAGKQIFRCKDPGWIEFAFNEPFLCRNIYISGFNYQTHRMTILASDDGENFHRICKLDPPRSGWFAANGVTHAIPPTKARFFRFCFDLAGSEPGSEDMDQAKWVQEFGLKYIRLSSEPAIHQFEGKNGAEWRHSLRTTTTQIPDSDCIPLNKIKDITGFVDENGELNWDAPKGKWTILRMGHTTNGKKNGPAGVASGLECDKFNPDAINLQFDSWVGRAMKTVGEDLFKRTVSLVHVDSWECGNQNWSPVFRDEFLKRRGYDILPYLPALAGVPINSADKTERVLYDVRKTISELITDNFCGIMQKRANENGFLLSAESVAPVTMSDGMMHYKNADIPMGEFWLRSPTHDKPTDILDAVSGADIYGKKIVAAEAFTECNIEWDEHPGMLKKLQDFEFSNGINRLVFHVNCLNPWTEKAPGMTLDNIGLYFQRDQTWWKPGKAWMDYTSRCQAMLQAGKPVIDLAVYTGDDYPRRAIRPEHLVPMLPGLFGEERVQSEQKRLANEGNPLTLAPNNRYFCGTMTYPEEWANPMHGYSYDSFNTDVLLNYAKVEDGKLVLPGGMEYRALIVPGKYNMQKNAGHTSTTIAERISEFARQGLPVFIDEPADKTLSMCDLGKKPKWKSKSRFHKLPYQEVTLDAVNISRDFSALDRDGKYIENIAYRHRKTEDTDIYFIANLNAEAREMTASLRVSGKTPQIWLPVSGEIIKNTDWTEVDGHIEMPLYLEPYESIFLVLKEGGRDREVVCKGNRIYTAIACTVNGPWNVTFKSDTDGYCITKTFANLSDWCEAEEPEIKYYSGTAHYQNEFTLGTKENRRYFLEITDVRDLATVKINGKECGTLWTFPYRLDITDAVAEGKNTVEIEVTNTWANRIRAEHDGVFKSDKIWTKVPYTLDRVPMHKSGITGQVTVTYSK